MGSDHPTSPRAGALEPSLKNLSLQDTRVGPEETPPTTAGHGGRLRENGMLDTSISAVKVISSNGDVVIEYTDGGGVPSKSHPVSHRWQVASRDLVQNSPYFRVLLDPNKFIEGRQFVSKKTTVNRKSTSKRKSRHAEFKAGEKDGNTVQDTLLPIVELPIVQPTHKLGVEVIELFLKTLSLNSFSGQEQQRFYGEMRFQPPWLISRLIEMADIFNSPHVVRDCLRRCGYCFGKGKISLTRYTTSLLKISEDRIRQSIFIAMFLEDQAVFQVLTHALIVLGSKFWLNGVGMPDPDRPRWQYFQNGLEEELYYRRQCVLNTITDLQAYFLRAYGAMDEDPEDLKPKQTPQLITGPAIRQQPRQFQCRWAFGDSSACDAFNLGQMLRFFSLRTRTIFLGSTLIDPDFTLDPASDRDDGYDDLDEQNGDSVANDASVAAPAGPPAPDIASIIASLKQCPDYQIDSNHTGCGVRRRLLPALDCIERFVGDGRGLLGLTLRLWDRHYQHATTSTSTSASASSSNPPFTSSPLPNNPPWSWASRSLRRAHSVDIRFSKIISIHPMPMPKSSPSANSVPPFTTPQNTHVASPSSTANSLRSPPRSPEEDARLFFTARRRNWEA